MGDSLLSQIVTLHLDSSFPKSDWPPGVLTRMRARVVADETLRTAAEGIGLDALAVSLAPPAQRSQASKVVSTGKPLASMFEALIAACWKHHGAQATSEAVIACLRQQIDSAAGAPVEPKSRLQELLARSAREVRYDLTSSSGPAHAPKFEVQAVRLPDGAVLGHGEGGSKKAAEVAAALDALERIEAGEV